MHKGAVVSRYEKMHGGRSVDSAAHSSNTPHVHYAAYIFHVFSARYPPVIGS